jgi:hypothetical protein
MQITSRVVDPDLYPDWIRILWLCRSGFNDFVDPDPDWESGSRIRIPLQIMVEFNTFVYSKPNALFDVSFLKILFTPAQMRQADKKNCTHVNCSSGS